MSQNNRFLKDKQYLMEPPHFAAAPVEIRIFMNFIINCCNTIESLYLQIPQFLFRLFCQYCQ